MMSDRWFCNACGGRCDLELKEPSDPPLDCPWGCPKVEWLDVYEENERLSESMLAYEDMKRNGMI